MKKIDFTKLNSANVSLDNLVDEARSYDINARANLNDDKLTSIESGSVKKDDVQVATFTMWSDSLTPSFIGVTDAMEMCNILIAITTFIADAKKEIEDNPINI